MQGRQNTDLGSGPNTLLDPFWAVLVSLVDELQGLDICFGRLSNSYHAMPAYMRTGVEVFGQQVVVILADRVEKPKSMHGFQYEVGK